ncbi:glutathione synthase [Nematocida sp. AWRm77]|nr:glutathione synthase [Nematocida sp. AWRm77]
MCKLEKMQDLKRKHMLMSQEGKDGQETSTTMFPSAYREEDVQRVFDLQRSVNEMVQKISEDKDMLDLLGAGKLTIDGEKIDISASSDKMYGILEHIRTTKQRVQKVFGTLIRADYIENLEHVFKQVEINTISCSFIVSGQNTNKMHEELLRDPAWAEDFEKSVGAKPGKILVSEAPEKFAHFIKTVSEEYGKAYGSTGCFVMLDVDASPSTKNYLEKKRIVDIAESVGVEALHVSVQDFLTGYALKNSKLFYLGKEVGIVYYRWLYNADQYSEKIVQMRVDIESSFAVSIPTAEVQIAGLKFFQKLLGAPSFLARYTTNPHVGETFVQSLSVAEYKKNAPKRPYVLKPLHEGGGHNFFGDEARKKAYELSPKEAEGYIMMEEIEGRLRKNRTAHKPLGDTIGEIGVFGYVISSPNVQESAPAGYILRTKYSYSKEVGVSAGFGSLDTIILSFQAWNRMDKIKQQAEEEHSSAA